VTAKLWEYRAGVNHDVTNPDVDGDTVDVRTDLGFDIDGLGMRLRLLGVDCPEKKPDRAAWLAAKNFTHDWLARHADPDGRHFIRTTSNTRGRDKADSFGRFLATVYNLVDGDTQGDHCLNTALLDAGHAVPFVR
jgi:endonuclease YncB( thermonuclease family)